MLNALKNCDVTTRSVLGPVSRKPRKLFGPAKLFLGNLYLITERCVRPKLIEENISSF